MREIRGVHVIVDGYVEDVAVFESSTMKKMFDSLVDKLDMEYLTLPVCCKVPIDREKLDSDMDEGGQSWFCQITTSHIALHAWPLRGAFMMDIFSCKPFNVPVAMEVVEKELRLTQWVTYVLDRYDPKQYSEGSITGLPCTATSFDSRPS